MGSEEFARRGQSLFGLRCPQAGYTESRGLGKSHQHITYTYSIYFPHISSCALGVGDKSLTTTHVLSLAPTQVSSIQPANYPGWAKATLATVALVATATICTALWKE